jgi:hypothetical protein
LPSPPILIGPADQLPALSARVLGEAPGVQTFADGDALRALEVITRTRPALVMLERRFASTARGSALIARIKADPSLADTEVRVVPPEGEAVAAAAAATAPSAPTPAARTTPAARQAHAVSPQLIQELDFRGTRRAPRHRVSTDIEVTVDGNRATIVDLSTVGVQITSPSVLKPNQRVRVTLTDSQSTLRCAATVVWATFEIPKGAGPRYRAGLEFVDADAAGVDALSRRHKQD